MPSSTFCDSFAFFGRPCVFRYFAAVLEQSSNLFRRKSGTMRRGRTEDWGCGGRTPSALAICFLPACPAVFCGRRGIGIKWRIKSELPVAQLVELSHNHISTGSSDSKRPTSASVDECGASVVSPCGFIAFRRTDVPPDANNG